MVATRWPGNEFPGTMIRPLHHIDIIHYDIGFAENQGGNFLDATFWVTQSLAPGHPTIPLKVKLKVDFLAHPNHPTPITQSPP
jgi:hypothetical protein